MKIKKVNNSRPPPPSSLLNHPMYSVSLVLVNSISCPPPPPPPLSVEPSHVDCSSYASPVLCCAAMYAVAVVLVTSIYCTPLRPPPPPPPLPRLSIEPSHVRCSSCAGQYHILPAPSPPSPPPHPPMYTVAIMLVQFSVVLPCTLYLVSSISYLPHLPTPPPLSIEPSYVRIRSCAGHFRVALPSTPPQPHVV